MLPSHAWDRNMRSLPLEMVTVDPPLGTSVKIRVYPWFNCPFQPRNSVPSPRPQFPPADPLPASLRSLVLSPMLTVPSSELQP